MQLVPVPTTKEYVDAYEHHWMPLLPMISKRSKEPVAELAAQIRSLRTQVLLAFDDDNKAVALAGVQYKPRGNDMIGELIWCTGHKRTDWQHLVAEIERYLKDMNCVECRPICRLGWSRQLKQRGYKITHLVMEKRL